MSRLRRLIAGFARNEGGTAAVEFALIMPFLLALYFGSMEASALFTADKRVNSISSTVGDLTAQWDPIDGSLPQATLTGYFAAATGIITPYSSAGVKQVVATHIGHVDSLSPVLKRAAKKHLPVELMGPHQIDAFVAEIRSVYRGPLSIAHDLMRIDL